MTRAFESSSAGLLSAETILECGVCWWVYDPAKGDADYDLLPGTAFSDLPEDFCCPSCEAAGSKFMVLSGGDAVTAAAPKPPMEARIQSMIAAFEKAEANMIGLPIHNDKLSIEAVGFRPHEDGYVGVLITPWSMNLAWMPEDGDKGPEGLIGASRLHAFPSGRYSFLIGRVDGFGILETCSLFSPMEMFDDHKIAVAAANAAIEGLFEAPAPRKPAPRDEFSRRSILNVGGGAR
ncbi:MAG: [NiFe]-hydrogenase assembly chaperone HybE [Pseudomonadota bacterium]